MAASIFVDPVIVTIPDDGTGKGEVEAWVQSLELWLGELNSDCFEWLYSKDIAELLAHPEHQRLASAKTLRDLANQYDLEINSKLLGYKINNFFRNEEKDLANKLANLGYMASGDLVTIEPEEMITRWPDFIRQDIHNLLITCSICKNANHPFASNLYIVTSKLQVQNQEMKITAKVKVSAGNLLYKVEDPINQIFSLLFTLDDLWSLIDIREIWQKGEDEARYLINLYFRREWFSKVPQPLEFSFDSHFLKSVEKCGLDTNASILLRIIELAAATIAEQITHIASAKRHPVRKSRAPDSLQVVRNNDQAKKWRLNFAGWRLHYWHIPGPDGGKIEFADIETEGELLKKRKKPKT